MIAPLRKSLAALPVIYSILHSHNTIQGFLVMLFGGMFLWIPYWLAWWLSDGFCDIQWSSDFDSQTIGLNRANGVDDYEYSRLDDESGYRSGPQGFGFYSGSIRIDN